jgi:hypothetical protein
VKVPTAYEKAVKAVGKLTAAEKRRLLRLLSREVARGHPGFFSSADAPW